jgi:hypothetical protein
VSFTVMINFEILEANSTEFKLGILPGSRISQAIADCVEFLLSQSGEKFASFSFNGVTIKVKSDSNSDLLVRDYMRALRNYISTEVGPYPIAELPQEVIEQEKALEKAKEIADHNAIIDYQSQQNLKLAALVSTVEGQPMTRDQEKWQEWFETNENEPYSKVCFDYAELWARLMEKSLTEGKTIPEVKDDLDRQVHDCFGVTGFQHGCIISILSECWEYGDQLRRIHNLET